MAHILVLEDDLALSAGLCFELDACGHLTVAAYHCEKARQLLEKEAFDLALFDVNLPDGSGFDLCREVKEKYPNLPVLFLTANDLEWDEVAGLEAGADDYITKPFSLAVLRARVNAQLRRAAPAQPERLLPLTSAGTGRVSGGQFEAGGRRYTLAQQPQVFVYQGGSYRHTTRALALGEGLSLTGWYDKTDAEGGRIRVIVAQAQ